MKQERLENLADGIFAIVMTLLVLELKVPTLVDFSYNSLTRELIVFIPYIMSYVTSFFVLYIFWHSHHFVQSLYAKNLTVDLSSINALFLFFIGLVPFTSHLLAVYHQYQFAIIIFSAHIMIIGCVLFYMRHYIKHSPFIDNHFVTRTEENHSKARILFPVACGGAAIVMSFISPFASLFVLTLGILFNFSRKSTTFIFALLPTIRPKIQ